ncbi:MAG: 2-succinyl-6-hydroxy-2,4-cyclohexadiene-1-carboxylate synthase [candidate division Zixibacteria bacterium]|nr:2-succinyl-6-hydroxy-2,4-cyclohexadiene-1-carboxylate synthase [candidate division Zixibacteria bacterium]
MSACKHLYYETQGSNKSPAIVMLHGFLGSSKDWSEVAETLKEKFFCILPDLPGHGRTMPLADSDYTMQSAALSLLAILNREEIKQCSLVGYSMGGRLALYMTLTHPKYFSKLMLESASPGLKTEKERNARIESDGIVINRLRTQTMDEFITSWYSNFMFDSIRQDREKFEKLLKNRSENNPEALSKSLKFMGTGVQPPLWHILPDLIPPTLLIVGADDNKFKSVAFEMEERSAAITVVSIENAGHNAHFERPQEYIIELQKFLI